MDINIDGSKACTASNMLYRGQGMISCNGTSRLLLDYKENYPHVYNRILEYLFGENGLGFTHYKLEMGADVNTSSGTEPEIMRSADEIPDVTRGAGFQLAADIKRMYPHVTLDMLWWSEPKWVSDAEDVYAARYKWYKASLNEAYRVYGLKFDYVGANRNEREIDADWIIYLSEALKNDNEALYDFSAIKIVAADECGTWNISQQMTDNERLRNAVDVIGSHYTSFADEQTKLLAEKYGKEIWFSEGSAPMNYSPSAVRFDEGHSGLTGINGPLDIANRMITMVSGGYMTLYEYQPAVTACYDGVCYCSKQLITANTPWNGFFTLDSGFFTSLHFSRFIKKGWRFIFDACHADGKTGGDGHALTDAVYSYITACNDEGDLSTVITNTTKDPITYRFCITGLSGADKRIFVWETRGPDGQGKYDMNYFKRREVISPCSSCFEVTVKPYSIVTVTSLDEEEVAFETPSPETDTPLPLPYRESISYSSSFLSSRGGAPLYTTDQGGAFEIVEEENGKRVLKQIITPDIKADEWGATPEPVTNFGDDRWYNYSVSADILLDGQNSYAGVGLRYILAADGISGYSLRLYGNGEWQLWAGKSPVKTGRLADLDPFVVHTLKISAVFDEVSCFIDSRLIIEYRSEKGGQSAGRAALYSSYSRCSFENIIIEPSSAAGTYVKRLDDLDMSVRYSEDWEHHTTDSFRNYRRSVSKGRTGAYAKISFDGTGVLLTGGQSGGEFSAELDGKPVGGIFKIEKLSERQTFFLLPLSDSGKHILKITVLSGEISIDSVQVLLQDREITK